jgi:hypothetical protein
MAILSYETLYHFDNDLFDGLELPTQLTSDEDDVINAILWKSMELEALYPDPDVAKQIIEIWSKSRVHSWQRIADALYKNYDPFVNFTRDETRRTEYRPNLTNTTTGNGRGFNSNTMVERAKTTETNTGNAATIDTFHSEGDSAMFTPTDIAGKETELRAKFDLINIIVSEFLNNFCLMIY